MLKYTTITVICLRLIPGLAEDTRSIAEFFEAAASLTCKGEECRSKRSRPQPLSKALTSTASAKGLRNLRQGLADGASRMSEALSAGPCQSFCTPLAKAVPVRALLRGCGRPRLLLNSSPLPIKMFLEAVRFALTSGTSYRAMAAHLALKSFCHKT